MATVPEFSFHLEYSGLQFHLKARRLFKTIDQPNNYKLLKVCGEEGGGKRPIL